MKLIITTETQNRRGDEVSGANSDKVYVVVQSNYM